MIAKLDVEKFPGSVAAVVGVSELERPVPRVPVLLIKDEFERGNGAVPVKVVLKGTWLVPVIEPFPFGAVSVVLIW